MEVLEAEHPRCGRSIDCCLGFPFSLYFNKRIDMFLMIDILPTFKHYARYRSSAMPIQCDVWSLRDISEHLAHLRQSGGFLQGNHCTSLIEDRLSLISAAAMQLHLTPHQSQIPVVVTNQNAPVLQPTSAMSARLPSDAASSYTTPTVDTHNSSTHYTIPASLCASYACTDT